jgi:hypothetical protein
MKVGELLEAYPDLEATLIGLAPEFAKLRNPILRRTVAKVATLHQAARIGGLDVRELVRTLRAAAGQPVEDRVATPPLVAAAPGGADSAAAAREPGPGAVALAHAREEGGPPGDASASGGRPAWLVDAVTDPPIDADALLAAGTHPLGIVRQRLAMLAAGRVLHLVSTFRPVPLIDALTQEGYAVHAVEVAPGRFSTYFRPPATSNGQP